MTGSTELGFRVSPNTAGFWLFCAACNLAYVAVTAERGERARRLQFIALLWPHNLVNVLGRYLILWLGLTRSWLYFALLVPLTVFDTTSIQILADLFEGRPLKRPTLRHVGKFVKVAAIESIGYVLACQLWPWLQTDAYEGPTVAALAHAVWRTALFDVGLDLGFYTFHRCCHVNRTLYRLVHAPHHTDTGKEYGHLVASETYELSVVETLSILSSYLVGFELLSLVYRFTIFDIAYYVGWAHMIELLGHTEMSWSFVGHYMRTIPEILGLALEVPHHTMHHQKPLSNFSKRLVLFDLIFGTYEPPTKAKHDAAKHAAAPPCAPSQPSSGCIAGRKTHLDDHLVPAVSGTGQDGSFSRFVAKAGPGSPLKPRVSLARDASA